MKIVIHIRSNSGQLVTLQIYPMPTASSLHDCILTKHFTDKSIQIKRYALHDQNDIADVMFGLFAPEEINTAKYMRSTASRMILANWMEMLNDKS